MNREIVADRSAIGNIDTILWTDKTEFVRGLSGIDYKVLSMHGSTGNGKSMIGALKFLSRVMNSGRDKVNFVLAGRDITALERRFVNSNHSVFNWRPFKGMWSYKKVGVGGSKMTVRTKWGDKYINFIPFNNSNAYERIHGDTLHGVLVDEAVESDEQFLEEVLGRIIRTVGTWGIFTSNGGDPNHFFYTNIVNKCMRIEEVLEGVSNPTPLEEVKYFNEAGRHKDWLHVHMGLADNPAYTKEQLKLFDTLYPIGSFMHYSRVLGIRGFSQNAPFSPYMTNDIWIKKSELVRNEERGDWRLANMVFSVDSGGHVFSDSVFVEHSDEFGKWYGGYRDGDYGTDNGGHTVMLTGAFNRDYSNFVLIDTYFPNHMHSNINVDRMYDRVYNVSVGFPMVSKPYLFVDPADTSMLSMFRDKRTSGVRQVRPSVKRDNSIGLDEPLVISLIQQYMMRGQFKILDTESNRKWFLGSMLNATLESDGKLVDNRDWESDIQDGLKYIFSSMYRLLVRTQ